jgi:hypothetical protein
MSTDPISRLPEAFGSLLTRRCESWTVERFAAATGPSIADAMSMASGQREPTLTELFRIASALGDQPTILLTDVIAAWRPSDFVRLYRLGYRHKAGDFREQPRTYESEAEAIHVASGLNEQRHARGASLLDTLCTYVRLDFMSIRQEDSGREAPP